MSDPFRQNTRSASDDELAQLVEQGPVSRGLGLALTRGESRVTDRTLGFLESDRRRAFDDQRAVVFGRQFANELSAEAANEAYGVDGYLSFNAPVNAHRAAEMHRQAVERRYREEASARADLSLAETLGASLIGAATDPVMLPTWFIGGGAAAVRAVGATTATTRLGNVARGAAVGMIDGVTGGAVAEGVNFAARRSTGEDYTLGDAALNVVLGAGLGAVVGGGVGAMPRPSPSRPARPAGAIADMIARKAEAAGVNPDDMVRIAQLESSLDPNARNPKSSAGGLFQFIDGTAGDYGLRNRFDPEEATDAALRLARDNHRALSRVLGRAPDGAELYLAHQQGGGGAAELLRDPNRSAVDALAAAGVKNPARAIRLNGGRADMTAGEFAGLWRRKFGAAGASLEQLTPRRPPRVLEGLTEHERVGAFAEAVEKIAEDAPVDLGAVLARSGLDALDEASAVPSIRGRWLEADTAITRSGGEVPVRFALVELDDLKTSHSDDLTPETDYPQALQPRDRSRAGSQAANYALERDLNPDLLMRDRAAAGGAPIISPDGVVESGNGRAIALRRSANTGTEAWTRYRQALERQGFDAEGMERPVLVRMRTEPMTGAQRAEMARAMNEAPTEAFSPVEQARSDARRLDRETMGLLQGDDPFAASERPFLRGFIQRVAPGEANALTDARGAISQAGRNRVQAALVQAAYGDDLLTAALFENADDLVRGIGRALADAAPAWARMRAEAPRAMDLTPNLTGAVALIREARASRMSVAELLETRLGQTELFGGEAISPETEAMVRLMFRDEALTKPRGSDRIAEALKDYARGAAATPDGPDLFGDVPDGRAFLDTLIARYAGAEGDGSRGLAYAGGSEPLWSTREGVAAEPAGLDLRPPGAERDGPGRAGQQPEGGNGAGGAGGSIDRRPVEGFDVEYGEDGSGNATFWIRPDDATAEAYSLGASDAIFGWVEDGVLRIERSELKADARGQGLGVAMYERAAQEAARTGRMLASDFDVSVKAAHAWDALGRRGYDVKRHPTAEFRADKHAPYYQTADDSPVFTIAAPVKPTNTVGSPSAQARFDALIAADPELKALVEDTDALARQAGVEIEPSTGRDDPSTVAEAVRAAAFCLATEFGA